LGVKQVEKIKRATPGVVAAAALLLILCCSAPAFAASFKKYVTPMEGGNFLIKIRVTASEGSVYALQLIDPKSSIVDVYAPKGWCVVTDGGDYLARTGAAPIEAGKSVEFLIYSSTEDVQYTYVLFGKMEQMGKPGTI
jgi:hypothetical protein